MSLETFQAQLDSENEVELCHEKYESDEESENESIQEIDNNRLVCETVTTNEFIHHLTSVRAYIQSRGASDGIYNCLHEMEQIALQDKIETSSKNQTKITKFFCN